MSARIHSGLPESARLITDGSLPGAPAPDASGRHAGECPPIGAPSAGAQFEIVTTAQVHRDKTSFCATSRDAPATSITGQQALQSVGERIGTVNAGSKMLLQVPEKDKRQFEAVRTQVDNLRKALRTELGDGNRSTTLLPFVFRKKGDGGGRYEIGVAASGDIAAILSRNPALKAIVNDLHVVPADYAGAYPYPRFHRDKYEERTDGHAEQRALRWADARNDVEGIVYFAPTAQVCEGCLQSIYDRTPYDTGKQSFAFDPDDAIAPQTRSKDFFRKDILPARLIPGARERAIEAYLHPPSGERVTLKQVAERFGISPDTLRRWVRDSVGK
jgi:hypothetical protein